jgi:DNA-binding cell septation regulator SpoVG
VNVTEVTIYPVEQSGKLRAYASFVLDDRFAVHGCKVIETLPGRLTVCMPNRKVTMQCPKCHATGWDGVAGPAVTDDFCGRCGELMPSFDERTRDYRKPNGKLDVHRDVCHPLDRETRDAIAQAVLDKYREVAANGPEGAA